MSRLYYTSITSVKIIHGEGASFIITNQYVYLLLLFFLYNSICLSCIISLKELENVRAFSNFILGSIAFNPFSVYVTIMLKFLQNVMVVLMNVIYLVSSIRNGLRPSLKNYSLMLLF